MGSRIDMAGPVERVGVIGDVHTEAAKLAAALGWLRAASVETILCVGDIADGEGDADELDRCCELLSAPDVWTVCGNHDRWVCADEMRDLPDATEPDLMEASTRTFLERLPLTLALDTPMGEALLCHATGVDDMRGIKPFDRGPELDRNEELQRLLGEARYAVMIAGHTHMRMTRRIEGLTVVNAGTLHPGGPPGFLLLDFGQRQVRYLGFDDDGGIRDDGVESLP